MGKISTRYIHFKPPCFRGVCAPPPPPPLSLRFDKFVLIKSAWNFVPGGVVVYHPCDTVCRTKVSSRGCEEWRGGLSDGRKRYKELCPRRWLAVVVGPSLVPAKECRLPAIVPGKSLDAFDMAQMGFACVAVCGVAIQQCRLLPLWRRCCWLAHMIPALYTVGATATAVILKRFWCLSTVYRITRLTLFSAAVPFWGQST